MSAGDWSAGGARGYVDVDDEDEDEGSGGGGGVGVQVELDYRGMPVTMTSHPPEVNIEVPSDSDSSRRPSKATLTSLCTSLTTLQIFFIRASKFLSLDILDFLEKSAQKWS